MVTVLCLKWGNKYGPEYVNILRSMVKKNLSIPHRFVCVTENTQGIKSDIETIPLAEELDHAGRFQGWWYKPALFKEKVGDLTGLTLYMDLDVVITGKLDDFFTVDPGFWIIRDWNARPPRVYNNSSVFLFEIGKYPHVWNDFIANPNEVMRKYPGGDQVWITEKIHNAKIWPDAWCRSFKYHCMPTHRKRYEPPFGDENGPPEGCKIVIFHGRPNPPECGVQFKQWPHTWVKKYWRTI